MAEDFQRRLPSKEREIAKIKPEDIRVSLLGTVIDKNKEGTQFVLDDGTGKITVGLEQPLTGDVNQTVRVFGRAIPLEKGFELQGEVVQSMEMLDMELAKKVRALESGVEKV